MGEAWGTNGLYLVRIFIATTHAGRSWVNCKLSAGHIAIHHGDILNTQLHIDPLFPGVLKRSSASWRVSIDPAATVSLLFPFQSRQVGHNLRH
jgi:hypothetical protein